MFCADTEDTDALVTQIKGLKGENDRLREMQQSNSNNLIGDRTKWQTRAPLFLG